MRVLYVRMIFVDLVIFHIFMQLLDADVWIFETSLAVFPTLKEGTLIFNNVHRLNKQLLPAVVELANNGTYWSRNFNERRRSNLKVILIAEDQFEELKLISKDAAVRIKVPALRVRREDIESMVKYKLRLLSRTYGKQVPPVEAEALKRLQAYDPSLCFA